MLPREAEAAPSLEVPEARLECLEGSPAHGWRDGMGFMVLSNTNHSMICRGRYGRCSRPFPDVENIPGTFQM